MPLLIFFFAIFQITGLLLDYSCLDNFFNVSKTSEKKILYFFFFVFQNFWKCFTPGGETRRRRVLERNTYCERFTTGSFYFFVLRFTHRCFLILSFLKPISCEEEKKKRGENTMHSLLPRSHSLRQEKKRGKYTGNPLRV